MQLDLRRQTTLFTPSCQKTTMTHRLWLTSIDDVNPRYKNIAAWKQRHSDLGRLDQLHLNDVLADLETRAVLEHTHLYGLHESPFSLPGLIHWMIDHVGFLYWLYWCIAPAPKKLKNKPSLFSSAASLSHFLHNEKYNFTQQTNKKFGSVWGSVAQLVHALIYYYK